MVWGGVGWHMGEDGSLGQAAEEAKGAGPPRLGVQSDDTTNRHPRRLDAHEG